MRDLPPRLLTAGRWLLIALAALPAAWPYLGSDLPRTNDVPHHLYRTLALDRVVREGRLWPRWSPDLVRGYGYPVFNFFPPLSHYTVEIYHLLGLPLTTAYRAAVLTSFVLAAWFAYLLGRDLFGSMGGWVAAVTYVYSPYLLYDAHVRGSLPESQALALLPLLLLGLRRAMSKDQRWVVASAMVFAVAFLSHIGIVFQALIPLGIYLAWLGWREGWRDLWKPLAGLALGVLLTAFFWLPALAEIQYVKSDIAIARGYTYSDYFLTLRQMLSWPRLPADPALINPPVVRSLPQVALALAGVLLLWRWRKLDGGVRWQVGLWSLLLVVCVFLVTPTSRAVWETLPLLKQTLTPFRLLGMASLATALLAAAPFCGLEETRITLALIALTTVLILIGSAAWLYPPREDLPEAPTMADLVAFEQPPLLIGTTVLGEFLPRWVDELPDMSALADPLAAGGSPDRLALAEGISAQRVRGSALDVTYQIHAERATGLTYRQFYFPGWRATLDGRRIALEPSSPHGLVSFQVPEGEHTLRLKFGSTPPRRLGWALSALAALSLGALLALPIGSPPSAALGHTDALPPRWLLVLVGLLLVGKVFLDQVETPLHRSTPTTDGLAGIEHAAGIDFAGELRLAGYDLSPQQAPADAEIELTLYWQPLRPIGVVYDTAIRIVGPDGLVWSMGDGARPDDYRFVPGTDVWPPDQYVMDPRVLHLRDGTPPGEYAFRIALVRRDTGQTVAQHRIGQLVVTQPAREERALEEGMEPAPEPQPEGDLRLLGSRVDPQMASPGSPVRVTTLWQVSAPVSNPDRGEITLQLTTPRGESVLSTTSPIASQYSPSRWQPGDRLRSQIRLRLPASTPEGELNWRVQRGEANPVTIGSIEVQAPERRWTAPAMEIRTDTTLGEVATLLGANVQTEDFPLQPPATITVTLVWQAEAEMTTSYRVFLHLLDPGGSLVAQSDGEPARWTRPTTGWLPGEVVVDERVLRLHADVAPGDYVIQCGLYDLGTGGRLTTPDGSDSVPITTFSVTGQ